MDPSSEVLQKFLKDTWQRRNRRELSTLPWNLRLLNITQGFLTSHGQPAMAVYYVVSLPPPYNVGNILTVPTFWQLAPGLGAQGLTGVRDDQIVLPVFKFQHALQGDLTRSEIIEKLTQAWKQIYRTQTVTVYLVDTDGPSSDVMYYLSVDGRVISPNDIKREDYERVKDFVISAESIKVSTEQAETPPLQGIITSDNVNETAIVEAIAYIWSQANPGMNTVLLRSAQIFDYILVIRFLH